MDQLTVTEPNRGGQGAALFTCNTCGLTFPIADLQRDHMRTDWHRYNLKRRVASLPPITSEAFAEKMVDQQNAQRLAEEHTGRGSSQRSSGQRQVTKKDRKKEEKLLRKIALNRMNKAAGKIERPGSPSGSVVSSTFSLGDPVSSHYAPSSTETDGDDDDEELRAQYKLDDESTGTYTKSEGVPATNGDADKSDTESDYEAEVEKELQRRRKQAVHIPPNVCLVDGQSFDSVDKNVEYMSKKYGLYIPEKEYLVDLEGLITYLGEKVGLGNMCLGCTFQGRNVESVRAHMIAKSHVRIPYENTQEKLEVSEFYDFRSSYAKGRPAEASAEGAVDDDEEWEEVSDFSDDEELGDEADGEVYVDGSGYELTLAPGMRAGHRSLQRYFRQSIRSTEIVRDGHGTVVAVDPRAGGQLRTRDLVEEKQQKRMWKEARKHQNVAYRRDKFINNQPHYRDELLQ